MHYNKQIVVNNLFLFIIINIFLLYAIVTALSIIYHLEMTDEEFLKNLGNRIKILRTLRGMSQEDIMGALDIDRGYISRIECGKANCSVLYLRKIAYILGVDLTKLLNLNLEF